MPDLIKRPFDPSTVNDLATLAASDPFVTTRSRWSSPRWTFETLTPGYPHFFITWRAEEQSQELQDEFRMLAASLFLSRGGQPPYLKYSNAAHFAIARSYLARFMAEHSYESLAELDGAAFDAFQTYVKRSAAKPAIPRDPPVPGEDDEVEAEAQCDDETEADTIAAPETVAGRASKEDVEVDRPTYKFVSLRLQIWIWINWARADLVRAGVEVDLPDVFSRRSLPNLARELSAKAISDVEDLPDPVLLPILTEANRLLGEPAEQAIALLADYFALGPRPTRRADHALTAERNALIAKHIVAIEGEKKPWFSSRHGPAVEPSQLVSEIVDTIRDAAVLVLAAGIGWRISEAASVEVEAQDDDRLPSCILITRSYSGTSDHFWVRGLLSKHRPEPTPDDWLIGAALRGSGAEPMTVRAIRVLERLFRPLRRRAKSDMLRRQLVLNFPGYNVSFDPYSIRRIKAEAIRTGMQRFIKERGGLREALEPLIANQPKLKPYYDAAGENVRPHQWRRTFFRLLYRMDDNLLPAISRHFKHVSLAVTENGYSPRSPAAVQEREAAMTEELVARLFARAEGAEPPATGAEVLLARQREVLAAIIDGDTLEEAAPRLAEFAVRRDLRLWPAEHGACLIALNPDKAACHVRHGRIDWRADQPNLARRNPSLCCSCPNLSVTAKDLPFWQRRYRVNRKAWLDSRQDPAFRFARDRAAQAKAIIEHLGAAPVRSTGKEEEA